MPLAHSTVSGDRLFENAPPIGVERRLGLTAPDKPNVGRRALLFVLVAWVPLLVITLSSAASDAARLISLLGQVEVHTRYLVAAPLLIVAEAQCAPRLNAIIRHFARAGLVPAHQMQRFEAAVASTRRLVDTTAAEVTVIALAYALVAAAALSQHMDQLPGWQRSAADPTARSPAGWWQVLVSAPLLLAVFFGWIWRLVLWARLLWLISKLELRLIAAHSDGAASLGFVGHSVRAFAIVALAIATVPAGRSAHVVLASGALPMYHVYFNIGLLVFLFALFAAPTFVFAPSLMRTWRRGVFAYGALACHVGSAFEREWLDRQDVDETALGRQDFSATTDLYQIVSNVYAIRFVPISGTDSLVLATAMLLPFAPVALMALPADVIWAGIKGLLL